MPQHIRDEIISTHDVNFVVVAGAGTGKTTLLIEKIMALLTGGKVTMAKLAAITFTEKAAAEISVRLKEQLEAALAAGEDPNGHLALAREQLDAAAVTTLHGFAGRLLKERPVEAGLSPDHRVQDEIRSKLLFDEVYDRWEAEQLSEERREWQRLLENALDTELRTLAALFSENLDIVGDFPLPPAVPLDRVGATFLDALEAPLDRIRAALPSALDPEDKAYQQAVKQLELLSTLTPEPLTDPFRVLRSLGELPLNAKAGQKGKWASAESLEAIRQSTAEIKVAIAAFEAGWRHILAYDAYQVLSGFLETYRQEKLTRGVVEFQDLLIGARDLLRNREVRAYFQRRYKVLLVDEFQDTDPLQAEILFFLAEQGATAETWRDVTLAPGKLFIVGDPKQSIYRFRRADVEIFEEVRRRVKEQGGLERTLERNFRSLSGIVHFVNAYFGQQIRSPEGGERYQPEYAPLTPTRLSPLEEPRTELVIHARGDMAAPANFPLPGGAVRKPSRPPTKGPKVKGYPAEEARALEADFIARRLERMIDNETCVMGREGPRAARAGDVAILFRTTTHLDDYTDALRDHGIPFRVIGSTRFYTSPEIVDLANLLRAIAAPHDRMALVGVLRSPAFGLSDDEISAMARARLLDYRLSVSNMNLSGVIEPSGLKERAGRIYSTLQALHGLRDRISMPAMVAEALMRTHLMAVNYAAYGGEQKVMNLEKVRSLARMYESAGMRSLNRFSETLLEAIRGQRREEESSDSEEGDDIVRILTIHKAKGLEWPVVVLPGLASSHTGSKPFLDDREAGEFGFRIKEAQTLSYEELKAHEKPREEAERIRLFYVAMTRARDYLVLSGVHQDREGDSMLKALTEFLDTQAGASWRQQSQLFLEGTSTDPAVRAIEAVRLTVASIEMLRSDAEVAATRRSLVEVVNQVKEPEAVRRREEVTAERERKHAEREALVAASAPLRWIRLPRRDSLAYRAAAAIDFRAPGDARTLVDRAAVLSSWDRQSVSSSMRDEAEAMVRRVIQSDLAARVAKAEVLGTGIPLVFRPFPDLSVEGTIDLLLLEEDGSRVMLNFVDDADPDTLAPFDVLAFGLSTAGGLPLSSMVCFALNCDQPIERPIDSSTKERAFAWLETRRGGGAAVRPGPVAQHRLLKARGAQRF